MRNIMMSLFIALGVISSSVAAHADKPTKVEIQKLSEEVKRALVQFKDQVKRGEKWLDEAEAVLVFPGVIEGAAIIGSEYGEGALVLEGSVVDYYTITSASLGLQIGTQKKDVFILFFDEDALAQFQGKAGGWVVGANASATLFNEGAESSADTATFDDPVVVAVLNQSGLLVGADFRGAKVSKMKR